MPAFSIALAVGIVAALVVAGIVFRAARGRRSPEPPQSALQTLAARMPRDVRAVESRLTGMPWAPYGLTTRGQARSAENYAWDAEVARVAAMRHATDGVHLQAGAIADALRNRTADAMDTIYRAMRARPGDAGIRSDAAAIALAEAMQSEHPEDLPDALAYADAALERNERLPEALFNRAVILERMGLSHHAVAAWRLYLTVDGTSAWADEARQRLQKLDRPPDAKTFEPERVKAEEAVRRGDEEGVRAFVSRYREISRAWSEVEGLGRWAEAHLEGNAAAAADHLRFARSVGTALRAVNGETLLDEAAGAVERAAGADRDGLAEAHRTYRQARLLLRPGRNAEAEPLLARAAGAFDRGGSPMGGMARYYQAIALYKMQRLDDAVALLAPLAAKQSTTHRALDGNVHWQLGMCRFVTGDFSAALDAYTRSVSSLGSLGEGSSLGFARMLIADFYDAIGDRERAWPERVEGFRLLSETGRDDRLHISISGAARAELQAGRREAAASLLNVAAAEAKIAAGPETTVLSYVSLASLRAEAGDRKGALGAIAEARASVQKLEDAAKQRAAAALAVGEAAIIRDTEPARALSLLAAAERHYTGTNRRAWLPGVCLQQGRALLALGREEEAMQRLATGIGELERQRSSLSDAGLRETVFDTGEALFMEAIALLVRRSAAEEAFRYAERFRARTLFESVALRDGPRRKELETSPAPADVPPGVTVLEYVSLKDRLIGFALSGGNLQMFVVDVPRARLQEMVQAVTVATRERRKLAEVQKASAALREVLLPASAPALDPESIVAFVPDRFLQQVPFAMLFDARSGRYLLQDHPVAVAPSARLLGTWLGARRETASLDALVIGDPSTGGELEPLPASADEARAIAAMYARHSLVVGEGATRERFASEWSRAAVVHFGGHASTLASRGAAASLAFAGRRRADYLGAHEIARMSPAATRLVVVAACDSLGRGRERLENTSTLAHAFLTAGVPTVLGALWPIEDEPSFQLFRRFHRGFADGLDAVSALRQAQLALLASGRAELRHPASWAGVALIGNPLEVFTNPNKEVSP